MSGSEIMSEAVRREHSIACVSSSVRQGRSVSRDQHCSQSVNALGMTASTVGGVCPFRLALFGSLMVTISLCGP
jgi:hypothetical protein